MLNETRVIAARLFGERCRRENENLARSSCSCCIPPIPCEYDPLAHYLDRPRTPGTPATRRRPSWVRLSRRSAVCASSAEGVREFDFHLDVPFEEFLERAGRTPLPPYIHNDSAHAQDAIKRSLRASPAASPRRPHRSTLPRSCCAKSHDAASRSCASRSTLGSATFRPVTAESLDEHAMHEEAYAIELSAAAALERARREGRRIVAAGTTVVRALEGNFRSFGRIEPGEHATDIFITPGFLSASSEQ